MRRLLEVLTVVGVLAGMPGPAVADVVLSGPDSNAGTYSTAALAAFAASGVTVNSGGLTGVTLWGLLGGANSATPTSSIYGAITTSTPLGYNGKNAILRYYVVGTNASGQESVVSLGEINPAFGGTAPIPAFIAYQATGAGLLVSPELVVPGAPGRSLSDLTSLQLLAVDALPAGGSGQSTSVVLSGAVKKPGTYTKADLVSQFTPVVETVSGNTYTGVPLWTFIDPSAVSITSQIVVTKATDGYEVVLSLAELDPSLGGNPANLLPYADTGTDFPGSGVARTIFPNDNRRGRWESNLTAIEVPEPASLSLLGAGLALVGWVRRGRARTR